MPNPFARMRAFHRVGHLTNTPTLRLLTPPGIAVLTTKGRRSGLPRTRAIRAVRDGDSVYAVALLGARTDWLANIRAEPGVTLKLGRTTHAAVARILTEPGEIARSAAIYHPIAGWYDYFDYANFAWSPPTKGNVLRAHDEWFARGVPVVFELAP